MLCPAESGSGYILEQLLLGVEQSFWVSEAVELLVTARFTRDTEAHLSRRFKKETNQNLKAISNILGQTELCFQV